MKPLTSEDVSAILKDIDAANAHDPNGVDVEGGHQPAELIYGQRMSETLAEFASNPSPHLQIAVRAQHIERWKRPRTDYPDGRAGYLQWRRDAGAYHAQRVIEIMTAHGIGEDDCARVGKLTRKQGIKDDPEAQAVEDVACLVFMKWYFLPFAAKRTEEDLLRIVTKTARKMSDDGRAAALKLPLPDHLVPAVLDA